MHRGMSREYICRLFWQSTGLFRPYCRALLPEWLRHVAYECIFERNSCISEGSFEILKISSLLNWQHKMSAELTFENFNKVQGSFEYIVGLLWQSDWVISHMNASLNELCVYDKALLTKYIQTNCVSEQCRALYYFTGLFWLNYRAFLTIWQGSFDKVHADKLRIWIW